MEMSKSFATEWLKAIHLFEYRLLHELPEDTASLYYDNANDWFEYRLNEGLPQDEISENKMFRDDIDFNCFLISCRRLERAIVMAHGSWNNIEEKQKIKDMLNTFKSETPYLSVLRNVGEHFDDYLLEKGKNKFVDSRGLRVYSVEYEKGKIYKVEWLDNEIDIKQTTKAADVLYKNFIAIYKESVARRKVLLSHSRED